MSTTTRSPKGFVVPLLTYRTFGWLIPLPMTRSRSPSLSTSPIAVALLVWLSKNRSAGLDPFHGLPALSF